jgi:hypothetical protein
MLGFVYFYCWSFLNRFYERYGNLEKILVATPHVALGHFGGLRVGTGLVILTSCLAGVNSPYNACLLFGTGPRLLFDFVLRSASANDYHHIIAWPSTKTKETQS